MRALRAPLRLCVCVRARVCGQDRNGHLSFHEFERTLTHALGYAGGEEKLLQLWKALDTNSSGFITKGEFTYFWRLAHRAAEHAQAESDGARRREERRQVSEARAHKSEAYYTARAAEATRKAQSMAERAAALERNVRLADLFRSIDTDESGRVSAEELADALTEQGLDGSAEQVERMMHAGDADRDGTLTLAEFVTAATAESA